MSEREQPYIPAGVVLRELTAKAVLLGALLSALLAGANAYLGLFAGMTVSASIPAAVISMAALRMFHGTILENNIVQTSASAGESLAAGVIFTLPALILLGSWANFDYWQTTLIAGFGGVLGVLFTIPLRRALIVENPLRFPEGVATSEVLKVGMEGGSGVRYMGTAALIGALFKLGETGFRLWHGVVEKAAYVGNGIAYFGSNLSPALVAVGYIVGLNIAVLVFIGGALNWFIMIPIVAATQGVPEGLSAVEAAGTIWSTKTRYVGVGAMIVGGLWALVGLRTSLVEGIQSGVRAYRDLRTTSGAVSRTERDIPMQWVGIALLVSLVPLFLIFYMVTDVAWVAVVMAIVMSVAGFLFSAVAGYMAGLVGSSNNPISGVTIATILCSALLLLGLLGRGSPIGPTAAILIGGVVCCAAAIAGDNMQDLKAGRLLGATPYRQQIMQIVGVIAAAFVMAPILGLLLEAYGIGVPTATHPKPLRAPQATLMASVARGVFEGGLPWGMVSVGVVIAGSVIACDTLLARRKSNFRMPVLAVAVGIYLPFELSVPILIGGLTALAARRHDARRLAAAPESERAGQRTALRAAERNGLLFGAGLITGEALIGIMLAIPIVVAKRADALAFWGVHEANWPGIVLLVLVIFLLYKTAAATGTATTKKA
jgi:putative OPT family oligopeptide transporter